MRYAAIYVGLLGAGIVAISAVGQSAQFPPRNPYGRRSNQITEWFRRHSISAHCKSRLLYPDKRPSQQPSGRCPRSLSSRLGHFLSRKALSRLLFRRVMRPHPQAVPPRKVKGRPSSDCSKLLTPCWPASPLGQNRLGPKRDFDGYRRAEIADVGGISSCRRLSERHNLGNPQHFGQHQEHL